MSAHSLKRKGDENEADDARLSKKRENTTSTGEHPETFFEFFVQCGLGDEDSKRYETVFIENDVDFELASALTYGLLKEMNVKLGHQMRIMRAVEALKSTESGLAKESSDMETDDSGGPASSAQAPDSPVLPAPAKPAKKPAKPTDTSKPAKKPAKKIPRQNGIDTHDIRRKIRAAFATPADGRKKQKFPLGFNSSSEASTIDMDVMREQIKLGTEYELNTHDTASAVTVLEAITDECVTIGTDLGQANIVGYDALLNELAHAWVDIFLSRTCKLSAADRTSWETKLRVWDKSPDPEHGTFTDARWAVRHGWEAEELVAVLGGDLSGEFFEPAGLVVSRLNQLEREDQFEAAVALAQAGQQFTYAAKFLIKLDRVGDAEKVALKLTDPAPAFTIAQVARPLDFQVAFNVAMHSVAVADVINASAAEQQTWLCELAVSQRILPQLIEQISGQIRNKVMQFEFCKLLKKMEQPLAALDLAKICLTPYTPDQIRIYQEQKEQRRTPSKAQLVRRATVGIAEREVDPTLLVPREVSLWLWTTSFELVATDVISAKDLQETLVLIFQRVEDVEQLITIANDMKSKAEYSLIIQVGRNCLQLLDKQLAEATRKRLEYWRQKHEIDLLKQEQDALKLQRKQLSAAKQSTLLNLSVAVAALTVTPHYDAAHDNLKLRVCRLMVAAALESRASVVKSSVLPEKRMKPQEFDELVQLCETGVHDISHLLTLAEELRNAAEYAYTMRLAKAVLQKVATLVGEFHEREAKMTKLRLLQQEQATLQAQRKHLDDAKLKELDGLLIEEKQLAVLPGFANVSNVSQFDDSNLQAARLIVLSALRVTELKALDNPNPSAADEQKLEADLWEVVSECLAHIESPAHMMQLASQLKERDYYRLVAKVGQRCELRLDEMRTRLDERQKPIQMLRLLQDEQQFLARITKSLSPDQQAELQKYEAEVNGLKRLPGYDPANADQYERLTLQVAQQIITALFDSKQRLETKIARDLTMSEAQIRTERQAKATEISEAVDHCLRPQLVWDPRNMVELAKDMNRYKEYALVMHVGDKVLQRIEELKAEADAREPFTAELERLRAERAKLANAKKIMPADLQDKYLECELKDRIERQGPSYRFMSPAQFDDLQLDLSKLMLGASFDSKDELENKLEAARVAPEQQKIPQQQLEADRETVQKQIMSVVRLCLNHVTDPRHLHKLAQLCGDRQRKALTVLAEFADASHTQIVTIDAQREIRFPIQSKIDAIRKEIAEAEQAKKRVPFETEEKLKKLEASLAKLPKWPHFAGSVYNALEYSSLTCKNASLLASSAIQARTQLDSKRQITVDTEARAALAAEKARAEEQLGIAVHFGLHKLHDPEHLAAVQQILHDDTTEQSIDACIELGNKAQQRIAYLEELRAKRAPLQAAIDKIRAEQSALREKKKTLHPQREQELKQLEKSIHALDKWPAYAQLFRDSQYDDLNLRLARNMLSSVDAGSSRLDSRIAVLIMQDSIASHQHQIDKERQHLDRAFERGIELSIKHLRNPTHLYQIMSYVRDVNDSRASRTSWTPSRPATTRSGTVLLARAASTASVAPDADAMDVDSDATPEAANQPDAPKANPRVVAVPVRLGEHLLTTVADINAKRAVRAPLQKQLDALVAEEEELVAQKKSLSSQQQKTMADLKEKIAALPRFPYFAQLHEYHQFDRLQSDAVEVLASVVHNQLDELEQKKRKEMFENPSAFNHAEHSKTQKSLLDVASRVVDLSLSNVSDPNLLLRSVQSLASWNQPELMLRTGDKCFERVARIENLREARDSVRTQINVLEAEQATLQEQNKQLRPGSMKDLENLREHLAGMHVPAYVSTAGQHDSLAKEVSTALLNGVYQFKESSESKIAANDDDHMLTADQVAELQRRVAGSLLDAVALLTGNVANPRTLLGLTNIIRYKQDFDRVSPLGKRAFELINELQSKRKSFEGVMKELAKLREEKQTLELSRKQLNSQQVDRLRALELDQALFYLRASYMCESADTYDDWTFAVAKEMIDNLLAKRVHFEEAHATVVDAMLQAQVDADRAAMKNELEETVKDCLWRTHNVSNLMELSDTLFERKEFTLAIRAGQRTERRIEELRTELAMREQLHKEKEEIDQAVMLQKDGPTDEQTKSLVLIEMQLEQLPADYADKETLDAWTVVIAQKTVTAAKIEDQDAVLREQTTLAFKVESTPERWLQVKQLTSEHDWEEVKKDLVVYLLNASSDPEDKSFIDPNIKVNLLLTEGLWKECVAIFPRPSKDHPENLELLFKLWIEVEKHSPDDLINLCPAIDRYAKVYSQLFLYMELDKLFDQIQKKHADWIIHFYAKGIDMLMVTLTPAQYGSFIQFLRHIKKRLVTSGHQQTWTDWLAVFKMTHKGKKKLIGMVDMLGDSSWNVPIKKGRK
eukprot:TRINITY_DN4287_c0_g1_i1.p1 TRINITY_DN4287_c0_g1~~TRINITY_DN4287_c0_g1_i1.p1  ORF type:complete len:2401 (-),score=1033.05 TRINITY_DN4287_c0_g1_i1:215-7417(-)